MIDFGKWAFNNKKLVNFLVVLLVIGGLSAYYSMSKLEDPAIRVKQALVVTVYPGASAHEVELEVTDVLEKAIRKMPDLNNVQSVSYNDLSMITVELDATVPENDIEQHWDILRRKVNEATASLPSGARTPAVKDDFGDVYGMFYALTGDGLNDRQLADYAELVKREISKIEGVSRVDIYGKRSECINVQLLQDKMANLGVKPTEVLQTLNGQNKTVYSGYFNNGDRRIRVSVSDKFKNVDDIRRMIIQGHEQDQLRLQDIALVSMDYEKPTRNEMTYDGERALGISISVNSGSDIVKVGGVVSERIENGLMDVLPAGVRLQKVFYQPERVSGALNTFLINLVESVTIVVLVLILTMGLQSGLMIGISLVVIVFGSFWVLGMFGGTLQRVSLAAFILAMGMLVDNAIVIVDGILVDLKSGKPRLQALTDIGKKTAMPLLGATLIAILAFLPIFLSPDTTGIYVRDLFIVMAVSLMLSWILALVHVPLMANSMLGSRFSKTDTEGAGELYSGWPYRLLRAILNFGLKHRVSMVIIAVALCLLSIPGYQLLPKAFFPDMEYDQLYMEYKLPEGANYTQVEKDLKEISAYLRSRSEVKHITASVGGTPSRYNLVRSIATPSLSYGELIIDFESPSALVDNMEEIQQELTRRYPQAYVKLKRYNLMYKKFPIEVNFMGPDPAVLHQLADTARSIMEASGKVRLITSDWEPQVPVLRVDYDQPQARALGVSRGDVGTSLLAYTDGIPVGTFYNGIHPENIYVKCVNADGTSVESISDVNVFSLIPSLTTLLSQDNLMKLRTGNVDKEKLIQALMKTIPVKQVSNGITIDWEDPVVPRYNGERSQRVQCSPVPGIGTEAAREVIAREIEAIPLPQGYSLSWEGEKKASDQSMKYLFRYFPASIMMMIAILIMLFKDYKKPIIIFCCIPLILVGVIPAMLISGKDFGFVAIVGVLGLIGMMIKNGIVLMDEISLRLRTGGDAREALIQSSLSRLRPVMMASLTTILGMIPLLPDAMFGPLAATIMGGLFMGTLITLIFIPTLYALFFKMNSNKNL
jgi:multidrug efflux pump subunit AcrB